MDIPRAGWTSTSDKVEWAENFSAFLLREKANAERCLRDCEKLLNDPNVKSDSLKVGLRDLRAKTEDNFGTLLHLERVLDMKNHGDVPDRSSSSFNATTQSVGIPQKNNNGANMIAASAPQVTQTGRFRQERINSIDFGNGFIASRESATANDNLDFDSLTDELLYESRDSPEASESRDDFDDDSGMECHCVIRLCYSKCFPYQM